MKPAKNQKAKLTPSVGPPAQRPTKKYPLMEDLPIPMVEDFAGEYHRSINPQTLDFRSSLPYKLMGCAQGLMSNMTDEEIKAMMIHDKYGL
jgi:hypothetical protein